MTEPTEPTDCPTPEDLAEARALLRRSAIEMYQDQGHDLPDAERLAEELLQSPVKFRLPTIQELEEVDYADMTPEQQRIVDAGDKIAGTFPDGLSKDQLSTWIEKTFVGWRFTHWHCTACHHEWDGRDQSICDWCGSPGKQLPDAGSGTNG